MTNWTDSLASKPWPPMQSFVRRRLSEAAGILLFLAALLVTVLLASYDHEDPSWSHAVDAPVQNWIGPYGASVADVLCQTLGGAALILPFVFFAWSFRLLLNRGLTMLWLRLVLLPPSALLAATALAIIPAPHWWGLARVGLGGWFGDRILGLLAGTGPPAPPLAARSRRPQAGRRRPGTARDAGPPGDARPQPRRRACAAAARPPRRAAAEQAHGRRQRGGAAAERPPARDGARRFRRQGTDREGAARPGGHALRARAGARHQGVADHRPRRRHRTLDERGLGARRRRPRPQRHRHRAAQRARRDGLSARAPRLGGL